MDDLSRRNLLAGGLWIAGSAPAPAQPALRIGLVTDIHYADREPAINRYYRDSQAKLRAAVETFNREGVDIIVELGDLIDSADSRAKERGHLDVALRILDAAKAPRWFALGNHCVTGLTKQDFLSGCGQRTPHLSFERAGFHIVILDSCFTSDGAPYGGRPFDWKDALIPREQVEWLRADLAAAKSPALVFLHHRLDTDDHYSVRNKAEVRALLEESGKVIAVFQGHNHVNDLRRIGPIPYLSLTAMVEGPGLESNAYAVLDVFPDRSLRLRGFGRQSTCETCSALKPDQREAM
jgi:alkaline phosphatase